MANNTPAPSNEGASKVAKDLQAIPFGTMIGAPLSACIEAQKEAALTSVDFIRSVGFSSDKNTPEKVITVSFKYERNGKEVTLTVPLLTIVPIPFISIDTVNISFKANLKSIESSRLTESSSDVKTENSAHTENYKGLRWLGVKKSQSSLTGSVSTKKDSRSTQNSNYSIEATIDINIVAHQESMPAGLSKVLEMLNNAISVSEAEDKK